MTLDASLSIDATNSFEKMLAHQMAAVHKLAMEQMGQVSYERGEGRDQAGERRSPMHGRVTTGPASLTQGPAKWTQRITVQYVNVSNGIQAVIANIDCDRVEGLESPPDTKLS